LNRASLIAVIAVLTVAGVRISDHTDTGIPFIAVRQGINPYQLGRTRVFVVRAGSVVTAFSARSGRFGAKVQWCPRERTWWAPKTKDLFSESGKWAFGAVSHDMITFPTRLSDEGALFVDTRHPRITKRSDGRKEIPTEIFEFYGRYLNYDPSFPTPTRPVYCPNPVT
jgi:hypothetical protein